MLIDTNLWQCSLIQAIAQYLSYSYPDIPNLFSTMSQQFQSTYLDPDDIADNDSIIEALFNPPSTSRGMIYTCKDSLMNLNTCNNANTNESDNIDPVNKDCQSHSLVVNLSSRHLCPDAISILNKGMKFCPTPGEPDISVAKKDIDYFHLRMKRHLHFNSTPIADPNSNSQPVPTQQVDDNGLFKNQSFKSPSSWAPPPCTPLEIYTSRPPCTARVWILSHTQR